MKWIAIAVAIAGASSACGGARTAGGDGSGSQAMYAKKVVVDWGMAPSDDKQHTDVFLQTNDDQGRQVSYPVGSYAGECRRFNPAPDMGAVSGVACSVGANITELHAVVHDEDIVVLRLHSDPAHPPDAMSREEVTRVKIPRGTGIHHD